MKSSDADDNDADSVLFDLDSECIGEVEPGPTLLSIYCWLWLDALPPLDGRRERERARMAQRKPSDAVPEPAAAADLYFGDDEHELGGKLRAIDAQLVGLKPLIELVAQRQVKRAVLKGAPNGERVIRTYAAVIHMLSTLRGLVEPTSWLLVPHSMQEWLACRLLMELRLHDVGVSDAEIAELLPGGGSAAEVYQRRYRAGRRAAVTQPALEGTRPDRLSDE